MDEDDLDRLLDEVEKKFCHDVSVTSSCRADTGSAGGCEDGGARGRRTSKPQQVTSTLAADIDALLEELLEEDDSVSQPPELPREPELEKKPTSQSKGRKSCDQLRCTSCDFRVLMFDDWEWDSSCDYLFLRNNMPEVEKLRAKLRRRSGARAYACQCSWFSTQELADLRERSRLRWVCGKHPEG